MPSEIAKKVAGTFIADSLETMNAGVLKWITAQCRDGALKDTVKKFCEAQVEVLDPSLLVAEAVTPDCIQCKVPVKIYDHESPHTFLAEIKLKINPTTGVCTRC